MTDFTVLTNVADTDEEWVRGFLLRLGYHLAAEYHLMPPCELRDIVGNHSAELVELSGVNTDDPDPPPLRAVN